MNETDRAIDALRAKLTGLYREPHEEGYGEIVCHLRDGRTLTFDNIRVDSVSPGHVGTTWSVLEMETSDETIVHVPNVDYFTFDYRIC